MEHDFRSIFLGAVIGFTGAGGQLILFQALRSGPAYLVFPLISLSPVITILLSYWLLKERTGKKGWVGILLALCAIPLLSYQSPQSSGATGSIWIALSLLVFFAWGFQAYVMKFANERMKAESIFFYMMLTSILLAPVAFLMTDMTQEINWGFRGPYLSALIQVLNAIGALMLVYAIRYGKVILVTPMTNALAPAITVLISLLIYAMVPHIIIIVGMVITLISISLLTRE